MTTQPASTRTQFHKTNEVTNTASYLHGSCLKPAATIRDGFAYSRTAMGGIVESVLPSGQHSLHICYQLYNVSVVTSHRNSQQAPQFPQAAKRHAGQRALRSAPGLKICWHGYCGSPLRQSHPFLILVRKVTFKPFRHVF